MVALLLGATVFGVVTSGPIGIFAGPVLAIFGWFYLIPIGIFVSVAMVIARRSLFQNNAGMCLFVAGGGMIGSLFMAAFGVKEIGNVALYTVAYSIGGGLSGATVAGLIVYNHLMARH